MELITLGSIMSMKKGKKPKVMSRVNKSGYVPYVDIKAFEDRIIDNYADPEDCLLCEDGDILILCDGSRSGLVGKAIAGAVGSTLAVISAIGCSNDYLYYFLQSLYTMLNTKKKGTGTPHLNPEILKNAKLVVPPLPEQKRIVSRIEELFSQLDASVADLQAAKKRLKVYRQAVLKETFEGIDAPIKRLEDLCYFITKGTTPPKTSITNSDTGIPFIKVYNLTFNNTLDFSIDPTFIDEDTHRGFLSRSITLPGDVLMNIVGPPMGKVSIVPDTYPEWNINQAIVRFRCLDDLDNKYLAYYLGYVGTVEKMKSKAKATAGQFNLTLEICRNLTIPVPSYSQQEEIVTEIESRLSVCDSIEQTVDTALQQAEALRQSILKQAFEGGL